MSEFAKVNPSDISPKQEKQPETVLSPRDNARLINILKRAKAAEADEDTILAIRLYEEYLEEFEKIKRGETSEETSGSEEGEVTLAEAERIFGEDFHGPEAVEKTFDFHVRESEVPPIPFSQEDLERAKELGQMLILRPRHRPRW
ncbi:MAG: hypothetical protein NTW66_03340 [Candidatus Magasanikbacteria bacterium]|nr:hypothetical protein [Candidatus Magasanikbacteria bacterium]